MLMMPCDMMINNAVLLTSLDDLRGAQDVNTKERDSIR